MTIRRQAPGGSELGETGVGPRSRRRLPRLQPPDTRCQALHVAQTRRAASRHPEAGTRPRPARAPRVLPEAHSLPPCVAHRSRADLADDGTRVVGIRTRPHQPLRLLPTLAEPLQGRPGVRRAKPPDAGHPRHLNPVTGRLVADPSIYCLSARGEPIGTTPAHRLGVVAVLALFADSPNAANRSTFRSLMGDRMARWLGDGPGNLPWPKREENTSATAAPAGQRLDPTGCNSGPERHLPPHVPSSSACARPREATASAELREEGPRVHHAPCVV